MKYNIPFNKPYRSGKEIKYIKDVIKSGKLGGDGFYTKKCQEFIEKKFKAKKALLTTSCTTALEMAALLCDIKPGDEVILPSYTFASTATAFHREKAKLKFVDIDPLTLNIDPEEIRKSISKRTKVIVVVHYASVPCDMDKILKLAKDKNLLVVEDAAQGFNAKYKNKYLGTIGDLGAYSFHETKNYVCGEGGALVINNEDLIERAEIIREKGTNRSKFLRGEVDKYTWVDVGSSFLPSDILAAFLYAQLEDMEKILLKRKSIHNFYQSKLVGLEKKGNIKLPRISSDEKINYHLFYLLLNSESERNKLMDFLKNKGIAAYAHYVPLHSSPMGRKFGYKKDQMKTSENISKKLLRLPFYFDLKKIELQIIVNEINNFFDSP